MKYGINIKYFSGDIGIEKAAELASKTGFTHLNYTPPVLEDNWETDMKEAMKIFDSFGLVVHQTHAPFNRYGAYGDKHKLCLDRTIEATIAMGAKYIAVHGDEFDFDKYTFSPERALEYNRDLFSPYVKQGEQYGFRLGFETVFEDGFKGRRFTSQPDELKKLILSFESPNAVCCWDFGHANVSFPCEHASWLKDFGGLVQCTHVHDNAGNDSHQMPLTGDIKWGEVIPALKESGFDGVMSIEYSHGHIPLHMTEGFLKLTMDSLKYIYMEN